MSSKANIIVRYPSPGSSGYFIVNGEPLNPSHISPDIAVEPPQSKYHPTRVTVTFLADDVLILNSRSDAKDEARRIVARAFGDQP